MLPLEYEPYSLGKSPIKALQYLSCGVPIVGNIEGAVTELLNDKNSISVISMNQWEIALGRLIENQDEINRLGQAGIEHVKKHHNLYDKSKETMDIISGQNRFFG